MTKKLSLFFIISAIVIISVFIINCTPEKYKVKEETYTNLKADVKYVGMDKCASCHANIYETFIETGMGKSFDIANRQKSSASFNNEVLTDTYKKYNYFANWVSNKLYINEFRLVKKDTTYLRVESVNYIIGSGQHTNSHIHNENGYLTQMPMTFYTQKKHWDFPPGFENGFNSRYARKIGLECMSCHNSYPDFVKGSENKYNSIPNGISCERCHGPGELHIKQFEQGIGIDTAKYIDYSIVNPAKLAIDLQFDLCSRCHLQGNAVLNDNKSFYDFKPGMKLSDVMTVFLPKYKNADDEFIMASHADRLKQSKCFIASAKKVNNKELRPYKNALTCITCHNPHLSVKKTGTQLFNNACINCHATFKHSNEKNEIEKFSNCVSCHMPQSGSIDIPHVTVHDHYIRVPVKQNKVALVKHFIGLKAINNAKPNNKTMARAYIAQYEKFELKPFYLDSALKYLKYNNTDDVKENFDELINLYFLKNDFSKVLFLVNKLSIDYTLNKHCTNLSYDNKHAWTAFRIANSFMKINDNYNALLFYKKASMLAPYNLEFAEENALLLVTTGNLVEAANIFKFILLQNEKMPVSLNNYGFLTLQNGDLNTAENFYKKALLIDPDYENALMNMAGLYLYQGKKIEAKKILLKVVSKNKNNTKALQVLTQLN